MALGVRNNAECEKYSGKITSEMWEKGSRSVGQDLLLVILGAFIEQGPPGSPGLQDVRDEFIVESIDQMNQGATARISRAYALLQRARRIRA